MRWITRLLATIGFVFLIILGGGVYSLISFNKPHKIYTDHDHLVLKIALHDLTEGQTSRSLLEVMQPQSQSLYDFIKILNCAAQDAKIKGIMLNLNKVQLTMAKVQEVQAAIKDFRKKGKFVVAYADSYGEGSNGTQAYYLASTCDDIVMQPMGGVSLMGLAMEIPFLKKLMDEWGIESRIGTREEFKTAMETFTREDMSPENRLEWQTVLNELLNQILKTICIEREINIDDLRQIVNKSPCFKTDDAKTLGLIDHVKYIDECESYALNKGGIGSKFIDLNDYSVMIKTITHVNAPKIALIYGVGKILSSASSDTNPLMTNNVIAGDVINEVFDEILSDKDVKSIVFRINSPGGSPLASETVRHCLDRAKKKGIPVIISMGDYAASGGYWVASNANKIVSLPATLTGSIGVYGGKFVFKGLWDKLGIHWDIIKSGQNADIYSLNQDFTPEQHQRHEQELDYIYQSFLERVADGRHMSLTQVREIARGRVWTGEQALSLGLVDVLGGLTTAINTAKAEIGINIDQEVNIEIFPRKQSLWKEITHLIHGNKGLPQFVGSKILFIKSNSYSILKKLITVIEQKWTSLYCDVHSLQN